MKLIIVTRYCSNCYLALSLSVIGLLFNLAVRFEHVQYKFIVIFIFWGILSRISSIFVTLFCRDNLMAIGDFFVANEKAIVFLNSQEREINFNSSEIKIGKIRQIRSSVNVVFLNKEYVGHELWVVSVRIKSGRKREQYELLLNSINECAYINKLKSQLLLTH